MLLEARKVDLNLKRLKWFSVKLMVLKKSLKIEKLLAACQSLHGGICQFHSGMSQLLDGSSWMARYTILSAIPYGVCHISMQILCQ